MYVQIGSPKEPSDVVDLLLECHERIRTSIGLACKLGKAQEPAVDEIRDASRVSRYFSEALPLHVADEEESILPRLAQTLNSIWLWKKCTTNIWSTRAGCSCF